MSRRPPLRRTRFSSTHSAPAPDPPPKSETSEPEPEPVWKRMNHYEILRITPDATATEVREAFYTLAKRLHPDVNPSLTAREEFERLQEAFKVLKDPKKRAKYNVEFK